jgi:hypothetical protein
MRTYGLVCSQAGGTELVAQEVRWEDARWIAALSPALAPHLEAILRRAAKRVDMAKRVYQSVRYAELLDGEFAAPLALAEAILGSGVDTP